MDFAFYAVSVIISITTFAQILYNQIREGKINLTAFYNLIFLFAFLIYTHVVNLKSFWGLCVFRVAAVITANSKIEENIVRLFKWIDRIFHSIVQFT